MATQISFGVIAAWTKTIAEQFALLAGKSAPHDFLQLIIYKAMTFSEEIESIDTVRAYHVRVYLFWSIGNLTGPFLRVGL
jgi:hypothetical protein